ncbi:transglutaminase-like cysteine peptidase [Zobellella iuensis]|uniref:Transglutaminase-like cysteine peptidase n=1 Tax=Zobellella iuensis TaxID=2803811 RepID=A0ABS1QTE2_9GAMM|nr:transglutaminase-like cysteine peptidase [Zobellella iuensis]MBL1378146.1 transglutaminase-like cysteine peptidase [Zobellella iuensis]
MWRRLSWWLGLVVWGGVLGLPAQSLLGEDENMIVAVRQFYGEPAARRTQHWRQLIREGQSAGWSEQEALSRVNLFFNRQLFIDDIKLWGKDDYWTTPLEFLGAGGGDCEDFSIAKYFSLLELGIDDAKLRLVYVKALRLNQFHMVVAYYPTPNAIPLILDNLEFSIRAATERTDLEPIYSFNGQHLWLMRARGQGELAGESSRLSLWNELRGRVDVRRLQRPIINLDE